MWVTAYARGDQQAVLRVDTSTVPIDPPLQANVSVEFDGETNQFLQKDIQANMALYTIRSGELWRGGRLVIIQPPGLEATDWKSRLVILAKLKNDELLTEAEIRVALRYLLLPRPSATPEGGVQPTIVF